MTAARTTRGVASLAAVLVLAGCLDPGVPRGELADAPIALLWYDEESARRRAEQYADELEAGRGKVREPATRRGENRAVAPVAEITRYLEALGGRARTADDLETAGQLALLDPRTGEIEAIPGPRPGALPMQWSPDRERLLFSQVLGDHPGIFEYHLGSGVVTAVSHGNRAFPEGCYGPDGRFVLTSVDIESPDASPRIVLTEPGRQPRPLSPPGVYATFPACAPDGSAVAWVDQSQRRPRLVAQVPPGTGEARILGPGRDPFFSPDSEWIVYSAPAGHAKWRLWRIRPDGSGRAPIGRGSLNEFRPTVSPDGRHVVYVTEKDLRALLYLRRFDGTGDRILLGRGAGERPVW